MSTNNIKQTNSIKVEGMTCINCALNIERSIKKIGIEQAHVNFANKELVYEPTSNVSKNAIIAAIHKAGFSVEKDKKANPLLAKLITWFSFATAIYFMVIMLLPFSVNPWIDWSLALISLLIGYFKFGKGAYFSIKAGSANMYVLILLGATTAFLFSSYLLLFNLGAHLYFETTAVLIALVLVGDILEQKALTKTLASISNLAQDKISNAKKIVADTIQLVSVNALKIGDIVQGNLGDEIHTDAIVTEGRALINESLITGESEPIVKQIGDMLLGGSEIIEGNISYKVQKNAHLSTKAKINQLVQNASGQKAAVQKLADKISGIFVPLIVAITVISFLVNFYILGLGLENSIIRSVAILVISCPCAMGLATPISIMVGLGKMSANGILVKSPDVFENFAKLEKIVFDKTGTLTTGKFQVRNIETIAFDVKEAKRIIVSIERKSSHPIAQSIVANWWQEQDFPLQNITEIKGEGMQALDLEGASYQFGNASFTGQQQGNSDLFLTKNGNLIAHLTIQDELKPNAKDLIDYFKQEKIESVVLSGDKQSKCAILQETINSPVMGELKPEDKLKLIDSFAAKNVAMLGDGVNDAPSLARVNVGLSFVDASNMAMQNADIILMQDDLKLVEKAHRIAKLTYKTIQQNLFWAFAYNIVAIPLAALGIIHPMWAAFFMIFSDLIVVGNAFILKQKQV